MDQTTPLEDSPLAVPPRLHTSALDKETGIATSTDGTITLQWDAPSMVVQYELRHTPPGAEPYLFRTGTDTSTVISGMPAGDHVFELRCVTPSDTGAWSPPLRATCTYMNRGKVVTLLVLGGTVVLATIGGITIGHLSTRHRPS